MSGEELSHQEIEEVADKLQEISLPEAKKILNRFEQWSITPHEFEELIEANPSLREMVLGYIAEIKLRNIWFSSDRATFAGKPDDHDRKRKGDLLISYRGRNFKIESKSLQTKTVSRQGEKWIGKAQVDASDSRMIRLPDGSELKTTLLLYGEFDLLAVNCFEFGETWRFLFAKNADLPCSNASKYTSEQKSHLISSLISVSYPCEHPFYENPFDLLDELIDKPTPEVEGEIL